MRLRGAQGFVELMVMHVASTGGNTFGAMAGASLHPAWFKISCKAMVGSMGMHLVDQLIIPSCFPLESLSLSLFLCLSLPNASQCIRHKDLKTRADSCTNKNT